MPFLHKLEKDSYTKAYQHALSSDLLQMQILLIFCQFH